MASPLVRYGVLGALEVHRDGVAVPIPSTRQRAVLCALLAAPGRPVGGDTLIDTGWTDKLPANPRAALNTVLSRLRGIVGADAVRRTPAGYALAVSADAVDAVRFETLLDEARSSSADRATDLLTSALGMWRGDAYAEFADRDAVAAEAARLNELRLKGIEDLAELHIERGEAHSAVLALEPFVEQHPFREKSRGLLMNALYQAGRAADALDVYQRYAHMLADDMGLDPSPALRNLQQRILNHDVPGRSPVRRTGTVSATVSSTRRWLATDTAFVGRDDDVADLMRHVSAHRLVTVSGTGGVGKSRLVAETLPALEDATGLPATVVEFAGTDAGRIDTTIAAALGMGAGSGDVRDAVLDYLSVAPALLVLDNCEHALAELRQFVQETMRRCPSVRIVATSRQRFAIPAEQIFSLAPLDTPGHGDPRATDLTASVRLFTDRARRAATWFALPEDDIPSVADICRRLDGLPLAIELAASRAATLGIDPLRTRLENSLTVLDDETDEGNRSLRATLDWSCSLLDEPDQALLATLGVFDGEFDLDAAEQVAGGRNSPNVAAGIAHLVDASLVTMHPRSDGVRYRLLEIVRAYAQELLVNMGIEHEARYAHATWVRGFVQAAADASASSHDVAAASAVAGVVTNVLSAIDWALTAGEPALAGEISGTLMLVSTHWQQRLDVLDTVRRVYQLPDVRSCPTGPRATGAAAIAHAMLGELDMAVQAAHATLATADGMYERYLALAGLSVASLYGGDYTESRRRCNELLAVDGLPAGRFVDAHATLALISCYEGRIDEAGLHAQRAEALAEATGINTGGGAFARYAAAEVSAATEPQAAMPMLMEAVRKADDVGVQFVGGLASTALLAVLTRLDHHSDALDVFTPLVERWIRLAAWPQLWTTLRIFAELLARNDRPEEALLLLSAAHHATSAPAVAGTEVDRYEKLTATLRDQIEPLARERIATLAASLPRANVVDRALSAASTLRHEVNTSPHPA